VVSLDVLEKESANRLASSFHYLCARGARRFLRAGLERCDLEQVAAVGLIKASRRYDSGKRTPFEAYAWLMILGELMHYVRDHERAVRVPRRTLALERDVAATRDALACRNGREPSDAEIGAELGILAITVADARRARAALRPLAFDDVPQFALAANESLEAEDRVLIRRAFGTLGTLERRVIAGIYCVGLTQLQLAAALQLTPKRISRIHLSALAHMRRAWSNV
jgi:RNA polymerase sigma-B factor